MPPASQFRVAWSFLQILRYLLRWLRLKVTGRLDEQQHAVRTRQLLERLSGIWIKVGQLLSLRTDLISDVMARELSALHYQARGFPPEIARSVIEDDLQRPLSAVFAHFEMAPLAAASIAQVHRATLLRNNRAVVVKVMRPDVARSFARDLRLLEAVVRWINRFGLLRRFNVSEGLAELRAILNEETNYQYRIGQSPADAQEPPQPRCLCAAGGEGSLPPARACARGSSGRFDVAIHRTSARGPGEGESLGVDERD